MADNDLKVIVKAKESLRPDYVKAAEADRAEIKKGNFNFKGIGYPTGEGARR